MKTLFSITIAFTAIANVLTGSEFPPHGGSPTCVVYTGKTDDDLRSVREQLEKKLIETGFAAARYPKFAPNGPGNTEGLKEYSWYRLDSVKDAEIYLYVLVRKNQVLSCIWWDVEPDLVLSSPDRVWEIHAELTSICLDFMNWSKTLTPKNLTEPRLLADITTILEKDLLEKDRKRNPKP